ncbi:hypothetical protein PFISCL1PPCAC_25367, partial [Pristionchus fissidentatus]
ALFRSHFDSLVLCCFVLADKVSAAGKNGGYLGFDGIRERRHDGFDLSLCSFHISLVSLESSNYLVASSLRVWRQFGEHFLNLRLDFGLLRIGERSGGGV